MTCIYLIYNPTEVKERKNQEPSTVAFPEMTLKKASTAKEKQYLTTDFCYNLT